jgi:hypothetical protein
MNQYILIRRLRGPAILLLIGILALLHTSGVIHGFWHLFWPLLLILLGVMLLAERAALAAEGDYPIWPFAGPHNPMPGPGVVSNPAPGSQSAPGTSIVPASTNDFGKGPEGGQS